MCKIEAACRVVGRGRSETWHVAATGDAGLRGRQVAWAQTPSIASIASTASMPQLLCSATTLAHDTSRHPSSYATHILVLT